MKDFNPLDGQAVASTSDAIYELLETVKKDPATHHFILKEMFTGLFQHEVFDPSILEMAFELYRLINGVLLSHQD